MEDMAAIMRNSILCAIGRVTKAIFLLILTITSSIRDSVGFSCPKCLGGVITFFPRSSQLALPLSSIRVPGKEKPANDTIHCWARGGWSSDESTRLPPMSPGLCAIDLALMLGYVVPSSCSPGYFFPSRQNLTVDLISFDLIKVKRK